MKSIIRHKDVREFEVERCALPGILSWLDSEDRKMSGEEVWEVLNMWLAVRNGATNAAFTMTGVVIGRIEQLKKEWQESGRDFSWGKVSIIMRVIQSLIDVEGKCKILSEGDGCNCTLCQIGRLDPKKVLAAADVAEEVSLSGMPCFFMSLKGRANEFKKEDGPVGEICK